MDAQPTIIASSSSCGKLVPPPCSCLQLAQSLLSLVGADLHGLDSIIQLEARCVHLWAISLPPAWANGSVFASLKQGALNVVMGRWLAGVMNTIWQLSHAVPDGIFSSGMCQVWLRLVDLRIQVLKVWPKR